MAGAVNGYLLTYQQAAARLGVHPSWLRQRVRARTIPFTRLGGRLVRFSEEQLDEIVLAGQQQPFERPAASFEGRLSVGSRPRRPSPAPEEGRAGNH